ncbi:MULTISPECIES: hypothetical protein [Rhizobium]|jgi:hypothetical protein|uniref:Uncharacterized protein n=1 Tax=Rhizobium etli TaxID=29449 RepID=A0A7W6ZMJ8_RHIET|nr:MULTISPECIES: hypothetical protein [Rhizobium]MBB4482475.1 hypothetical protein [Rhizobium etli]MBB4538304.1 hypothetical protein [Rhizobium etli]ULR42577.1 hypothetical protein MHI61_05250 [Rhizobium sp. K102]
MSTNDENVKPEQRRPKDVAAVPEKPEPADSGSMAPPAVQPAGEGDKSERPVVNPVTGVAF